jgi:hypothetical protein
MGEDYSQGGVDATVAAYFGMLLLKAKQEKFNKSQRNAALRQLLKARSQASVELEHQNISAVFHDLDLPFISGYKPRGKSQLLLRNAVQKFILDRGDMVGRVASALEEVKAPAATQFRAVLVDAPAIELVGQLQSVTPRIWPTRKSDFAACDEVNGLLDRNDEQWVLGFEQQRLHNASRAELF